jgi:hypothetical protein
VVTLLSPGERERRGRNAWLGLLAVMLVLLASTLVWAYFTEAPIVRTAYSTSGSFSELYGTSDVVVHEVTARPTGLSRILPPSLMFKVEIDATIDGQRVPEARAVASSGPYGWISLSAVHPYAGSPP